MSSFYVILRGPAGSGKTTLAEMLAQKYNGLHMNIDKVKKEVGLRHSEEEKLEANKIIIPKIVKSLGEGTPVILDEVLYYESQLSQLEQLPFQHYLFSLNTPLQVCLDRNRKRVELGGRETTDDAIRLVHNLVSKIKRGIVIDTYNQTIDESFREILYYLPG